MKPGEPYSDASLDTELRAVEVPPGLEDRLRPERLFGDGAIDRLLVDVAVPDGLAGRMQVRPAGAREVTAGGRRHVQVVRWVRGLARDGMAVALSIGAVVAMFFAGLWATEVASRATGYRRQADHAASATSPREDAGKVGFGAGRAAAEPEGDDRAPEGGRDRPAMAADAVRAETVVERPGPRRDAPPIVRTAPLPPAPDPDPRGRGAPPGGMEIVPTEGLGTVRRAVPRMRGFDLAFEMAHGESPFVDPSIAPGLAVDRPPLVVATDSFDRVWPLPPGRRRLAEIEHLRVEHLVAALSADVVRSGNDAPRLGLSAVRSIRPGRPTYLVEVRVAVPGADADAGQGNAPTDVAIVLDHSSGPEALPLWLAACRGLATAADRMGSADRLTIIVAEPRPRRVAIRATPSEVRRVCEELEGEPPFGNADLDAAVALAEETARGEGVAGRLVVVAHADRAEHCDGAAGDALQRWRVGVARGHDEPATGPRFVLVSGISDGVDSEDLGGVPGWTLSDPTVVRRRLAETVADRRACTADEAVLEVRFDPRAIAAYRLVGHRQSVAESLAAFTRGAMAAVPTAVCEGETVRVVYEVVPRREPRETIAGVAATLSYREASGAVRTSTASGAPVDAVVGSAPSPQGCELLLAVGLGETAGRSVHAPPRRLAVERLQAVASAWRRRGDVTVVGERLIGVLDDMAAAGGESPRR